MYIDTEIGNCNSRIGTGTMYILNWNYGYRYRDGKLEFLIISYNLELFE